MQEVIEVTVTCKRCDRTVTEWVAVIWQHEHEHVLDNGDPGDREIEVTDGAAIATLCRYCADIVETAVQFAVADAIHAPHAA